MHANARLTFWGRSELVARIAGGQSVAMVAEEMNVSRATAYKWWRRWQAEGEAGLVDRSSRPRRCPHRTPVAIEQRIVSLRQRRKLGPARIAPIVGVPASTVHRVLTRHGLHRLAWMDRPTGRLIRRIETSRPGELVHVDTKRLARIPPGGGWRAHGRGNTAHHHTRTRVGYDLIHTVIDAHTRVAYVEVHDNETGPTCAAVFERAIAWFADIGVRIEAVLSDNARQYQRHFDAVCDAHNIEHRRIRPYRPQTNGKVERFNRTLLDEWAYIRPYRSDGHRLAALARWLHNYNHHRCHTALDGHPPMSRVDNAAGQYS